MPENSFAKGKSSLFTKSSQSKSLPLLHPMHVPYRKAASYIQKQLSLHNLPLPKAGIICGSGLSSLSDALDHADDSSNNNDDNGNIENKQKLVIPYSQVPGFPAHCTVAGHKGEMVIGTLRGVPTICFRGRFHSYEGHPMTTVVLPVQVMRCLGVKLVVVTNAAGGLKKEFEVGDIAVIRDHIAIPLLAGKNPLVGPNDEELGPRFPPTSNLYDVRLQEVVVESASDLNMPDVLHTDGTYAFVSGPQYESKSECSMLRLLGADAVGMSTVPEVLAAHHAGMAVLCLSLITNKVVFDDSLEQNHANHEEVLEAVKKRGKQMVELVGTVVKKLGESYIPDMKDLSVIELETKGRVRGEDTDVVEESSGTSSVGLGKVLCPYHVMKSMLGASTHCAVFGGACIAVGAYLGMTMAK